MVSVAGARRTVTVVFCDLAGSTALGERLDPEALRALLSRWYEEMRAPLERHGGTVEKFIGDAVMAVFGVPRLHEDDALRAVRAALEMQAAAARVGEALGAPLHVRIGVNSGEVVVGEGSTTLVTGDPVNTAKRLEERAADGEVLIGEATRRLVESAVRLESAGGVRARGKRRPVPAWRVLGEIPEAPVVARRLDAPLVGRARELDLLLEELAEAERARACRLVTVLGPAGIGKSRLAGELGALVRERALVLGTRCLPYGDGITFWPLARLLREAGGDAAVAAAVAGEPDAELIVSRLRSVAREGPDETVSADETFWACRRLLESLARERPLVVVFEDVHWAEQTFLDLLEYVAGWARGAPILLVCLARPELLEARPGWGGTSVALEPLSEGECQQLLDELADEWPLAAGVRHRIAETAEGNPLFVEQLVAMVADREDEEELELPPSIQALLAARLDRLEPLERRVLERAAVAGREFWRGSAADLSPEEERPEVGSTLLRLVRKELVRPTSSRFLGDDGFRFRHALIRDAAYAEIPKRARADLHERFAAWVERHDGGDEIVGYHLEQAYRYRAELGLLDDHAREVGERAGELLAAAGRRARARDDLPAAVNLLMRAVTLLPDASPTRRDALPELASVLMKTGDFPRAESILDEALELARAAGDKRLELRTLIEREFFRTFTDAGATPEEITRVAAAAIPLLEELGDELGLAKAWWLLSEPHVVACRWGERAEALERALEHARRAGDDREAATLTALLVQALQYGPTPVDEAIERLHAFRREASGDRALLGAILSSLAALLAMRGQFGEARAAWGEARALWEELGMVHRRAVRSIEASTVGLLAGDAAAAVDELRAGYAMLEETGDMYVRPTIAAFLAAALVEQGCDEEAEALARFSEEHAWRDDVVTHVVWRGARAQVRARRGDAAEAERLAREAVALAEPTDCPDLEGGALLALASVLRHVGSPEAGAVAAQAQTVYERKGNLAGARRAAAVAEAAPA